jgi:F420-0:gamma-glutamyl ligase
MEKVIIFGIKWNELLAILISIEEFVCKLGKTYPFLNKVRVSESAIPDNLRDFTNIVYQNLNTTYPAFVVRTLENMSLFCTFNCLNIYHF